MPDLSPIQIDWPAFSINRLAPNPLDFGLHLFQNYFSQAFFQSFLACNYITILANINAEMDVYHEILESQGGGIKTVSVL